MNSDDLTFWKKVNLRQRLLRDIADPVILETHGGRGKLYSACYSCVERGMVIEKNLEKAERLARQRPTWRVYQADSASALRLGLGRTMPFNLLDVDAYGSPWETIDAFFASERVRVPKLWLVATDGLRKVTTVHAAWITNSLKPIVKRRGNNLHDQYLSACFDMLTEKAAQGGYVVSTFDGYYCGFSNQMTHFYAVLTSSK